MQKRNEDAETFRDVEGATTMPRDTDASSRGTGPEADDSSSRIFILDDTDQSLTDLDNYLFDRERRILDTMRSLQNAMVELLEPAANEEQHWFV